MTYVDEYKHLAHLVTPSTAGCACGHTKTVAAVYTVRVSGALVEGNLERVRCANCGEPRWEER